MELYVKMSFFLLFLVFKRDFSDALILPLYQLQTQQVMTS